MRVRWMEARSAETGLCGSVRLHDSPAARLRHATPKPSDLFRVKQFEAVFNPVNVCPQPGNRGLMAADRRFASR